jgi:Hint domain
MAEQASATITANQLGPTLWQYSLTLVDSGSTTVGTFWFAWIPGQDYLATLPTSVTSPTGWMDNITHGGPGDGYAIQWLASSGSSDIASGGTLTGFSFESTDTPSEISGNSVFFPSTPVTTSFVYSGAPFSDPGFQFVASLACFCEGTHIRTVHGDVPVEDLRPGDRVAVVGTADEAIAWIGHRTIDCRRHPWPRQVWPIRISRDAFAAGAPACDLHLSPDHAVYVDGMLVPAKCLVNGQTIAQVPVEEVRYFHIALTRHDVLLAEGLPVESYLDTSQAMFGEAGIVALHPDLTAQVWEAEACAPLVVAGPKLAAIKRHLATRARATHAMNAIAAAE